MPSLADLTRAWLLRQLGLTSSTLTEADLQQLLFSQQGSGGGGGGLASNVTYNSGRYYGPSEDVSAGVVTTVIDRCWAVPFEVGSTKTFDRIASEVTIVGSGGNLLRMGIYGTTNGVPDNLILDAGTSDASILGAFEKNINQQLAPGLYWLVMASQVGVPAEVRALGSVGSKYVGHTANPLSTNFKSYRTTAGVSGALPASFGVPVADSSAPKIFLRAL
jgi:hypothetical protein